MTINVNLFQYHKDESSLSAELSELEGHEVGKHITVKSYKTGNEINFQYHHAEKDASGEDTLAYVYFPSDTISPVKKLVIFND